VGLALTALIAVVAATPSLGARVDAAASRSGFTGEVAVARNGRLVFARGFGLAERAHRRKVTLDTAFNLASMGKMFTGVAAAQLVQAPRPHVRARGLLRRPGVRQAPPDADLALRVPPARRA
jgi:Beta-lactamase